MDNSRVKATIFFIEKISFSLKLFSGHFYGQSFIKTVQGLLHNIIKNEKQLISVLHEGFGLPLGPLGVKC